MYASSKFPFTLMCGMLLGNHYYHHRHKLNIAFGFEQMPEIPTIHNDPPKFNVNSSLENRLDKMLSDIERYTSRLDSQTLFEDFKYKGDYLLKDKMAIPHGSGAYEMGEAQVVGKFQNGNLTGPFELISKNQDLIVKGEVAGEKLTGQTVTYSKNCKLEMDVSSRSYVLTDQGKNKVFVQRMPDCSSVTKFYNKEGREIYAEYKNKDGLGTREVFEEDGSRLMIEMKDGEIEGNSTFLDRYGDVVYSGSFRKGEFVKRYACLNEMAGVLGIGLLCACWPRNAGRTLKRFMRRY